MPNTREKLIEMSEQLRYCAIVSDCANCKRWDKVCENQCVDNLLLMAADLIDEVAHGVTVFPVQVGDIVYGRFSTYGKEVHQCEIVKVKACQFKDRTVRYFLDLEFDIIDPFYRDGRLMRCGMQAIYGEDWGDWYRVYPTREEAEAQPPKGE